MRSEKRAGDAKPKAKVVPGRGGKGARKTRGAANPGKPAGDRGGRTSKTTITPAADWPFPTQNQFVTTKAREFEENLKTRAPLVEHFTEQPISQNGLPKRLRRAV